MHGQDDSKGMQDQTKIEPSFRISRRNWIRMAVYGGLSSAAVYSYAIEPRYLVQRVVRLNPNPRCRIVHFSDLHFRGPSAVHGKLERLVATLKPDFACFTGDLVDHARDLEAGFDCIKRIPCAVFGVPGNHEFWNGTLNQRQAYRAAFAATGGAWLENEEAEPIPGIQVYGLRDRWRRPVKSSPGARLHILLSHYPQMANELSGMSFDLILAGHSHGGQVRLPFWGPIIVPYRTGSYSCGLYETPAGPLNVSAGIGTYGLPLRFCCPPEVTLIEL